MALAAFYLAAESDVRARWQAGYAEGKRHASFCHGELYVSKFKAHCPVGEGVAWTRFGEKAWRTHDGEDGEEISLEEADLIVEENGLTDPFHDLPARRRLMS